MSSHDKECVFIQNYDTRALYAGFLERGGQWVELLKCRSIVLAYFHILRTATVHITITTNEDQAHLRAVVGSSYMPESEMAPFNCIHGLNVLMIAITLLRWYFRWFSTSFRLPHSIHSRPT